MNHIITNFFMPKKIKVSIKIILEFVNCDLLRLCGKIDVHEKVCDDMIHYEIQIMLC